MVARTRTARDAALWIIFQRGGDHVDRDLAFDSDEAGRMACLLIIRHVPLRHGDVLRVNSPEVADVNAKALPPPRITHG